MKRHYPDGPVVGVGAVIFRGEEVLLVRRGQEPALGSWSLPGGVVELGESLGEAMVREVQEETGLAVEVLGITAVLERVFRDGDDRIAVSLRPGRFRLRVCLGRIDVRPRISPPPNLFRW